MKKNYAVILAGCGYLDGSEIHESVLTLLAIDQANSNYQCFAANRTQHDVISHLDKHNEFAERNIQEESARIARGNINELKDLNADNFDSLIIPGGFGVAQNLCTYAIDGDRAILFEDIEKILKSFIEAKKPIGAVCIAPALLAFYLRKHGMKAKMTVGNKSNCENILKPFNFNYAEKNSDEIEIDKDLNIISTPAYMNDVNIAQVSTGISKMINYIENNY